MDVRIAVEVVDELFNDAIEQVFPAADPVIQRHGLHSEGLAEPSHGQEAQAVHAVLRAQLSAASEHADRIRLLYGGSMNAANAAQLLQQPDIDGGLVGGASLKAADFLQIIAAAR